MVKQIQKKARVLSRLEKLSLASRRRMGLEENTEELKAVAMEKMLKTIKIFIERRVKKLVEKEISKLKEQVRPTSMIVSAGSGVRSSPPPGSKKVKNLYVTTEGFFHIDYEDNPV